MLENIQKNLHLIEYILLLLYLSTIAVRFSPFFKKPKLVQAIFTPMICFSIGFIALFLFDLNSLQDESALVNSCYKVTYVNPESFLSRKLNKLQKEKEELLSQLQMAEQYNAQNLSELKESIHVNKKNIENIQNEIDERKVSEIKIVGLSNQKHIILTNTNNVIAYKAIDLLYDYHLKEATCSKSITMLNERYKETL